MRITSNMNILQKTSPNFLLKVKNYFYQRKVGLKNLIKDVFEKTKPVVDSEKKILIEKEPRKLPNSVSAQDEQFGIGGGSKIKFYQEDLDKMKKMSIDEKLKYTELLIENGRYYL